MSGKLRKQLSDVANTGAGEGGFAFDEDTMRSLVKSWQDLADDYDQSLRASRAVAMVVGPGADFASEAQATAANNSGKAYLEYLQHNRDYCTQQSELFQQALDDYLGVEQSATAEMNRFDSQGSQAGN